MCLVVNAVVVDVLVCRADAANVSLCGLWAQLSRNNSLRSRDSVLTWRG